ncbi:MAG: methyltransferase domain-containing protein [Bacteroidota bacterium]
MSQETNTNSEFDKSKIYENLEKIAQPKDYQGKIPWIVQQQIADTNGIHYKQLKGKLDEYPVYELPVNPVKQGLMLDIGCGWGRWLVAGANKGYLPIGIDIRVQFCKAARNTLKDHGHSGYTVVADLQNLPFRKDVFDLVWSFSVIQHTHKTRLMNCLGHIHRILKPGSFTKLEFPNKKGIRNRLGPVKSERNVRDRDKFDSWCVRYYSPKEYRSFFDKIFGNYRDEIHSFLGIGVLKEDLKYLSGKNKLQVLLSLALTQIARIITPLKYWADSLYYIAEKEDKERDFDSIKAVERFMEAHRENPTNNMNLIHLLVCPKTGGALTWDEENSRLVSIEGACYYEVSEGVPMLIEGEGKPL